MRHHFSNPYIHNIRRNLWHVLRWQCGYYEDGGPVNPMPQDFSYPVPKTEVIVGEPQVTWINHCTFLLDIDGIRILTDPIWGNRCSPIPWIGPKRRHSPPLSIEQLPEIDVVLLSHNHYDHLDAPTVKVLHQRFPHLIWFVPQGVGKWFRNRGIHRVQELNWWQESSILVKTTQLWIHAVPAQHHSGRGLFDANRSLWMGFVVQLLREQKPSKCLYFVGDTAYNEFDFKRIGERFPAIDLCLCPIGTYQPGTFMRTVHASPEDAVQIHRDVNARLSIGMHWKTFKLSSEEAHRPPYDLYLAMQKYQLNPIHFLPLEPGVTVNW